MKIPRLSLLARQFRMQIATLCVTAALPIATPAGQFTDMVVFGDSLSDTGKLQAITTQLYQWGYFPFPYPSNPQTPYYQGRFSSGPVWVEGLADRMGLPSQTTAASGFSLGATFGDFPVTAAGGNNYAVAAARTATAGFFEQFGVPVPTGVQVQVAQFLEPRGGIAPGAETLYVMMAGGNDIRHAAYLQRDKTLREAAATQAARDYAKAIGQLADAGAKTILVSNVNDIGKIPEAIQLGKGAAATAAARVFNAALPPLLAQLEAEKGVRLIRLDLYNLFNAVYDDATLHGGATYGLTNATVPCFAGYAGSPGADCAVSIFSDDIHPSESTHSILTRAVAACRDGDGTFLAPPTGETPRADFSRFCQTRQSP